MSNEAFLAALLAEGASPALVSIARRLLACACDTDSGTGPDEGQFSQTSFGALALESLVPGTVQQLAPGFALSTFPIGGASPIVGEVQTRTRTVSNLTTRVQTASPFNAAGAHFLVQMYKNGIAVPETAQSLPTDVSGAEVSLDFPAVTFAPGDIMGIDVVPVGATTISPTVTAAVS